jgi:hypothetical protein
VFTCIGTPTPHANELTDPQYIAAAATALGTVALAIVTWRYARSAGRAAIYARDTAEIMLLGHVMSVQPRLALKSLSTDFVRSSTLLDGDDDVVSVPIRSQIEVVNKGLGPALGVIVNLNILGIRFTLAPPDAEGWTCSVGEDIQLNLHVPNEDRLRLATAILASTDSATGSLEIQCEDSVGFVLSTSWRLTVSESAVVVDRGMVKYASADEEARASAPSRFLKARHRTGQQEDTPHARLLKRWRGFLEASAKSAN